MSDVNCIDVWFAKLFTYDDNPSRQLTIQSNVTCNITEALDQATPEQRKQLASKMRMEVQSAAARQNAAALAALDDDALIDIMKWVEATMDREILFIL